MNKIDKKDLILGEYYRVNINNTIQDKYLIMKYEGSIHNDLNRPYCTLLQMMDNNEPFRKNKYCSVKDRLITLATLEEKHWLNKCIELNKFITKEEAMKSLYPEYYECVMSNSKDFIIGKVYKIVNPKNLEDLWNFIG
jgi:hypothetical protein